MFSLRKKVLALTVLLVSFALMSGCTDYKKKYNSLNVEHQNLKGLYDNCKSTLEGSASEKEVLAGRLAESQAELERMKSEMAGGKSAADATGFDGYDVDVNAEQGTITVTLPELILFDSGKAALKNSAKGNLDEIVNVINDKYNGRLIDVVGHTDADPIKKSNWKDNWELSSQRALSVLRQLNSTGVPDNRLRAIGCGSSRPVAPNSGSGKAQNRRVEIVVHMK
ncbi:MAG: putative lipoprotein YiaD precursor [Planctomycetes bacterium ADurb.Bin401]|nr:MAG: putative lipoprotein YiaD precursor [Planctomycetes bacterium ADurb.Bin401]